MSVEECAACEDAAHMASLGWDDYYCRVHYVEPILRRLGALKDA